MSDGQEKRENEGAQTEGEQGFTVRDERHWAAEGRVKDEPTEEPTDELGAPAETAAEPASGGGVGSETRAFQAETRQLLELMIHSLYSNREIALRELISNASDALDRYRFDALTNDALQERDDLEIRLVPDPDARTLTIHDNGIGMGRQEVIDNIGTIARSGTRELLERLGSSGESREQALSLIGQFGVGFYASFMIAERVELITRRAGEVGATRWTSAGDGAYTLEEAERDEHGTSVTLFLRPTSTDADDLPDFTAEWTVSNVVKRYSDFVGYPIRLLVPPAKDEEGSPKPEEPTWRQVNTMKAIWTRRASEVEEEEYAEFYKHITHDWQPPLERIALHAEGRIEYRALLFVPARAPFDLFYQHAEGGLELYVRNVKIMERCEQLLPRYLRFIKGVVDSPDLPLNISRELLQHNRQLAQIRRGVVKKVLSTLGDLAEKRADDYATFWDEFGRALKEGVISDPENKERLVPLLRFSSSADQERSTSLTDYVARMKPEQEEIYYLTGESRAVVERSPHLEAARERGYEVLFLIDPIDELMVPYIDQVEGKALRSLGKGDVELGSSEEREEAEKKRKSQQADLTKLLELLAEKLDSHVKEVRLSKRLTSSAVCLVSEEQDESPRLRRLLRQSRQPVQGEADKRIMEINPDHPLTELLRKRFEADADDPLLDDYAQLLLGQGLLAEGSELPDPASFSKLVAELMVRGG